jgi:uncharacterized membrane protein YidH (DUF202 family)
MNNWWTIIFYAALLIMCFALANLITDEIKARVSPRGRRALGIFLLIGTILIIAIGVAMDVDIVTIQRP